MTNPILPDADGFYDVVLGVYVEHGLDPNQTPAHAVINAIKHPQFANRHNLRMELGHPPRDPSMSIFKYLEQYTSIAEARVAGQLINVRLEQPEADVVIVRGQVKPSGPYADVLREYLELGNPEFGLRATTLTGTEGQVTICQIITWDLVNPVMLAKLTLPPITPLTKTCGNCAYLGDEHTIELTDDDDHTKWQFNVPTGFYQCNYAQHHEQTRKCVPTDALAFVEDGSDFHAALKVKTDFGCVAYKPKLIPLTQD